MKENEKYTWDISTMYNSTKEWEKDIQKINKLLEKILAFQNKVTNSAENLSQTLKLQDELLIKLTKVYVFAKINFDTDMANPQNKELFEKADNIYTKVQNSLSFLEPELIKLTPETFAQYKKEKEDLHIYEHMFAKLFTMKNHILSSREEEILSHMNSIASSFEKIYDDLTVNDLDFPVVKDSQGKEYVANNTNYTKVLISPDRTLRKKYFKGLLGTYGKYINSFTSTYYGSVKHAVSLAKLKKYNSSREMALKSNFIPLEVYDNLIDTVSKNTKPLQDYLAFRKEKLQLEDIHFYDLFVPLVEKDNKVYTFEEAKELVLKATSILGEDYITVLETAFEERWIDVYPGKNKISGAYAISAYGHHPYSLLNFTGTLGDVFTLAHELGHVMHSYFSEKHQPFINSDYTIFTAEVASTVNEQLLLNYLLENSTNKDEKALLLTTHLDNVRSTLYRQTLFAHFEKETHQMVVEGQPLLPDNLCALHEKLYKIYHGTDFYIDDELKYEWARIPHFYSSFYVFQYSTGISAAISIAEKILKEKEVAVENYKQFLTKGGSDYSINLLKIAGVDMTSPQPIKDAIKSFENTLKQLKKLYI